MLAVGAIIRRDVLKLPSLCSFSLPLQAAWSHSAAPTALRPSDRINFSDGKVFQLKSTWEILRGLLIFRFCSFPTIVNNSLQMMKFGRRIVGRRLFEAVMRASVYGQFVAGENLSEIQQCMEKLRRMGIHPMLAVPIEEDVGEDKSGEGWYSKNLDTMLHCVDISSIGGSRSMMQLKVTALMSADLCKKVTMCMRDPVLAKELSMEKLTTVMDGQNSSFSCLTESEKPALSGFTPASQPHWKDGGHASPYGDCFEHEPFQCTFASAMAPYAKDHGVRVLVDAEYTYLNPALTLVTMAMMAQCNQSEPWIWNTYQCYLKESYDLLCQGIALADHLGVGFGVKLVRGAYMGKERKLAKEKGYEDPINLDWETTNQSYQRSLDKMLELAGRHGNRYNVIVASHNEESVIHAVRRMHELHIPQDGGAVCFGQLLGMCDQVSLTLGQAGYAVYKSIPYGSVDDVIPYLVRRAQENQTVLQGIRKERDLLRRELRRRIFRRS
ncbi:hydroxyproline dehydrogenase [Rhinatrema bivittatum]|uniref:hydroxyproline dehydrogenase n=1 Tax=Rhinatrema bivittatum TaxID=194408 RepID=UPI001127B04C|nr:hydroxyproline dehydrogenase [Rhinatrema bivittatum]XP_029462933.1 hydroxyproline dehydrogenase [Rhinatrema bivittatum]